MRIHAVRTGCSLNAYVYVLYVSCRFFYMKYFNPYVYVLYVCACMCMYAVCMLGAACATGLVSCCRWQAWLAGSWTNA